MNEGQDSLEEMDSIQYQALYREEDTPLDTMRSDTFRRLSYTSTLLVIVLMVLGFMLPINRYVHTDFVLRSEKPEITYQYYNDLYLEQLFVKTGDTVQIGSPLAAIQSEEIRALILDLRSLETELKSQQDNKREILDSEIYTIQLENEQLDLELENLHANGQIIDSLYQLQGDQLKSEYIQAQKKFLRSERLYNKELISEQEFENARHNVFLFSNKLNQNKARYRKEIVEIDGEIVRLKKQIKVNGSIIEELKRRFNAEQELIEVRLKDLLSELVNRYNSVQIEEGNLILTSFQQGKVSYHLETDKVVPAGTVLLKVEASGKRSFYAYAAIESKMVGRIYSDLPAIIKIDAYPHYNWGTIKGAVDIVSQTDNEQGKYGMKIILFNEEEFRGSLKHGMTGVVSIPIESKSLFGYLFDDIEAVYWDIFE